MPVSEVYIARHGFRSSWAANVTNTTTGTLRDVELSSYGVKQAAELATFLHDKGIEAIFASPWFRTLQTAAIAADALDVPLFTEPGIAEWFMRALIPGFCIQNDMPIPINIAVMKGTGLHPFPRDAQFLQKWFPRLSTKHEPIRYPPRTGETIEELIERLTETIQKLIDRLDRLEDCPNVIFLVGHAATVVPLGHALTGDKDLEIRTGCCSLSRYIRQGKGGLGSWTCDYAGRADFLSGGEERHWSFENIEGQTEEEGAGDLESSKL